MLGSFIFALMFVLTSAWAMPALPKEAARALRVTKGKSISTGVVFVDGKFLDPPYVVERYGNGIRINKQPVTAEVIEWDEFLKTQEGAKILTPEPPPTKPVADAPAPSLEPAAEKKKEGEESLDDLFADDPKPKRKSASLSPSAPAVRKQPTVEFSGEFVANDRTRAMVKRINKMRTEIDTKLRQGSLLCFGSGYSRVTGDRSTMMQLMEKLPQIQKESDSLEVFKTQVRSAGLVYLNERLCEQLYKNRVDYRRLQECRRKLLDAEKYDLLLNGAN